MDNEHLKKFLLLNKDVEIKEEVEHYNLCNLWYDNTFMCRFEKNTDFTPLDSISLPKELSAIIHKNTSKIEFIYDTILNDDEIKKRKFEFFYKGIKYKGYYDNISESLKLLATGFREIQNRTDTSYRNLEKIRDFFKQETLPKYIQKYFEKRQPVSFFIEGEIEKENCELFNLFKHLNFYMVFYDRKTPQILIFDEDQEQMKYKLPCISEKTPFPSTINLKSVDPILLDLLHVAKTTANIRMKYIFYYQVLEYCSYYYLNQDLKRRLNNVIKNPDILEKAESYSRVIIEEFKDYFKQNDDSSKLEKLIIDFCNYDDIKNEIECNWEYFAKNIEFDGGFNLPALIKNKEESENPPKTIMKEVKSNIDKIRNVLVHIRESRENKVIHPSKKNHDLLIPYLYLIRRISEVIAFRYE